MVLRDGVRAFAAARAQAADLIRGRVPTVADELASVPFLKRIPAADLRGSAPLWDVMDLATGEVLWHQGAAVDEIGVLVGGELVVDVDGDEVGRVVQGELCGEASGFFAGLVRSATLRAHRPSRVLSLATPALRTLRWQRSTVYEALLDQALLALVGRVGATNQRIAGAARGVVAAPARREPGVLARLWRAVRPGGPAGEPPPVEPLLRRQPGLKEVDGETLATLARAFVATPMQEGGVVCLEGEPGAAAWLVAAGKVDVLRHVRGERAELLASLEPGDVFGVNTLIERGPRTASCVAASEGWLYRLDADAFGRLQGEARLVWRESVLASLAGQIRRANTALQAALREGRALALPGEEGLRQLMRASGYLEAVTADVAPPQKPPP